MSYDTIAKMIAGDVERDRRLERLGLRSGWRIPAIHYAYPKEGIEGWMDNVAVLKEAENVENAKLFQNFIMDPENAALISDFAGYDNGIAGSDKFLPADFGGFARSSTRRPSASKPEFVPPCPPEVVEIYNKIWTELQK